MTQNVQLNTNEIKDTVQDCNINFLIGAGMSAPFLASLGPIEQLLTELEEQEIDAEEKKVIRASLYKKFFNEVILKNLDILKEHENSKQVLQNYGNFLKAINNILLKRKSTILSKQVNLFTSNIDVFLEKSLEATGLEYNDGFHGRFKPIFNLNNLKKSHFKKSLQYDNTSEIPVFNLLKIHGSLTWKTEQSKDIIGFSHDLALISEINEKEVSDDDLVEIPDDAKISTLVTSASGKKTNDDINAFMESYEKLAIVNPTKEKFKQTLLNKTYYDQLRIYANELEKENTVLFVMGFSFADEHIKDISIRAANSNPTLIIYIFARKSDSKIGIDFDQVKNNNIKILTPPKQKDPGKRKTQDQYEQNLQNITDYVFKQILKPEDERIHKVTVINDSKV